MANALKGFGIYVKNDLLDPKHHENMGAAIWLYLWLLDKMTSISEDGVGRVLGGKPIKQADFVDDLNLSKTTYWRYVTKLEAAGYINVTRAPYGLVIEVNKASKIFGNKQRDVSKVKHPDIAKMKHHRSENETSRSENETSNKTIQLDNTITIQAEPAILGAGYAKAKEIAAAIKSR